MTEFNKLKRFFNEATRIEDVLTGVGTLPFSTSVSYDDLRDFVRDAKRLAFYCAGEQHSNRDDVIAEEARAQAAETLQEMINERELIDPNDIEYDREYARRHGG